MALPSTNPVSTLKPEITPERLRLYFDVGLAMNLNKGGQVWR